MPHVLLIDPDGAATQEWARLLASIPDVTFLDGSSWSDVSGDLSTPPDVIVASLGTDDETLLSIDAPASASGAIPLIVVAGRAIPPALCSIVAARTFALLDESDLDSLLAETVRSALDSRRRDLDAKALEASQVRTVFQFELENDRTRIPRFVERLLREADRYGLFDERDRIRTQIALEEALLNAMVHGNLGVSSELRELDNDAFSQQIAERLAIPCYAERRVSVCCEIDRAEFRLVIQDQGAGFDVSKLPDPRQTDRVHLASGRGVLLMRSFMDDVFYNDVGNEVWMRKSRSASLRAGATDPVCAVRQ